jgi:molybdate transport system substrate-binding protein
MSFAEIYGIIACRTKDGLMLNRRSCLQHFACLLLISLISAPAMLMAEAKSKQEILVAAAASLKDVFEEIAPAFEKEHPNIRVSFQFAASGALQHQIEQGAPVDLFVSAAMRQVEALERKSLLVKGSVQTLLTNELVLIVPHNLLPPQSLADLKKPLYKRIALGESRSVPAGQYAEAWLQKAGLDADLQERLVPASNVRQVLTFVESGNVAAGFVYASDARTSQKVKIALRADTSMHPPIVYPLGMIQRSRKKAEAQAFIQFLQGVGARRIFLKHGFLFPTEKAS